jgi:hypothetical protein
VSILAGILTLVSVIFAIISFASSGKHKFTWLIIFICSLLGLFTSVYFAAARTAKSAQNFVNRLASPYDFNDSLAYQYLNLADSTNSKQVQYLKLIEPREFNGEVPAQFYHYLGYRDYYRLPLRYPFSLHCEGTLDNASLFNENDVSCFGVNDNGEEDLKLNGITHFKFDSNILLAKVNKRDLETNEDYYVIYHFSGGQTEQFKTLEEAEARARELNVPVPVKLFSCKEYYTLLN